jgi:hypothetical protein
MLVLTGITTRRGYRMGGKPIKTKGGLRLHTPAQALKVYWCRGETQPTWKTSAIFTFANLQYVCLTNPIIHPTSQ